MIKSLMIPKVSDPGLMVCNATLLVIRYANVSPLARSQLRVSDTQVTVKVCGFHFLSLNIAENFISTWHTYL